MSKKRNKKTTRKSGSARTRRGGKDSGFAVVYNQFLQLLLKGEYQLASDHIKAVLALLPTVKNRQGAAICLSNIAYCYINLGQYEAAAQMAKRSIAYDSEYINNYDVLSHAYGKLGDSEKVRQYGRKALELRDKIYQKDIPLLIFPPLPAAPSPATKTRNIISYSLFGALPRYCETAFLNIEAAAKYYPNWTCRIYIGDDVPEKVVNRLKKTEAQIIHVTESQKQLAGTCWRFLALDDDVDRVLFRDIDALLGEAEALAVDEWIASDKYFHTMRDWSTHTEIILAGMWGAVVGALPTEVSIEQQMLAYMPEHKGKPYFIDQYFLREKIWSVVRLSVYQHDSIFGFNGAVNFPSSDRDETGNIGSDVGTASFYAETPHIADGNTVTWRLVLTANPKAIYCEYEAIANNGRITINIAKPIIRRLENKELQVRLIKPPADA